MDELALMAATEWARAYASRNSDPVAFGSKVAQAYESCRITRHHAGDELAMSAALVALSVPAETLQAIGLLASLHPRSTAGTSPTHLPDAPGVGK